MEKAGRRPLAWNHFERLAPSYRRLYIGWIDSAKQRETKMRRLKEAIGLLAGKKAWTEMMRLHCGVACLVAVAALAAAVAHGTAAKTLDIYFIDVEGGQSTLLVTPVGQTLLIDAGFPGSGTFESKPGNYRSRPRRRYHAHRLSAHHAFPCRPRRRRRGTRAADAHSHIR